VVSILIKNYINIDNRCDFLNTFFYAAGAADALLLIGVGFGVGFGFGDWTN
jgi:hypothetical protein